MKKKKNVLKMLYFETKPEAAAVFNIWMLLTAPDGLNSLLLHVLCYSSSGLLFRNE